MTHSLFQISRSIVGDFYGPKTPESLPKGKLYFPICNRAVEFFFVIFLILELRIEGVRFLPNQLKKAEHTQLSRCRCSGLPLLKTQLSQPTSARRNVVFGGKYITSCFALTNLKKQIKMTDLCTESIFSLQYEGKHQINQSIL